MISAIIPVHRGGENLQRSLRSVLETVPQAVEVLVVADGSPEAARQAQALGAHALVIPERRGPAYARNLGARQARGDILAFVDADVLVPPDFFSRIAAIFQSEPDLAAVIGSYDDAPGAVNFLSQYKNLLHHYIHQTGRVEASTFWGACGAVRRNLFLTLGGFDERIPRPAMEDVEFGHRLRRAGHGIRLDKALQVKHLKSWTARSLIRTDLFARAVPWTELILRDRALTNDLNLRMPYRASVALVFAILSSLIASLANPAWLVLSAGLIGALLGLNIPLYRFFRMKRGHWFAVRAIAWQCFAYAYSGVGLGLGVFRYLTGRRLIRTLETSVAPRGQDLGELDA